MRKKHSFLDNINRAREAASARPESHEKPLGEMSESELDAELQKAQRELDEVKRREIIATRELAAETTGKRSMFAGKRRRPSWR